MKSIKYNILINFCILFIIIFIFLGIFVTWKLDLTIEEQSKILTNNLKNITSKTLLINHNVFESILNSLREKVELTTKTIISHPELPIDIVKFQIVAVESILQSFQNEIDYAALLDLEGHFIGSFPSEVGHRIDFQWIEKRYQSLDHWQIIQKYLKDNFVWDPDQAKKLDICTIREYSVDFIQAFDLSERKFPGLHFLSIESASIVYDDFKDPIAVLVAGKLMNGIDKPLKDYYNITKMPCIIYSGTLPIAYKGFEAQRDGNLKSGELQLSKDILKKIYDYEPEKPMPIHISLAGENYLTMCSPIEDYDGKKVGVKCNCIPTTQIIESEQAFLAQGINSLSNLKAWLFVIGTATLLIFISVSLYISGKLVKPISKLLFAIREVSKGDFSQQIEVKSQDEIGRLAQTFNIMVSRLEQQTNKLKSAKDAAVRANNSKSEFLANMSHELRTPLNHIIGFTELVVSQNFGELNEIQKEYLTDVLTGSRHLLDLINDILDIAKVEAGKLELGPSSFDLSTLLTDSLSMIKEKAMQHQIKLVTHFDGLPETFVADKRKLKQIMYNLLSNAVKFTPGGGSIHLIAEKVFCSEGRWQNSDQQIVTMPDTPALDPEVTASGQWVRISIKDTGIGIRTEDIERIFEPFAQVEQSKTRRFQGTGLGLSLTKNFVELHGGIIWAESEGKDKGNTFSLILPVAA